MFLAWLASLIVIILSAHACPDTFHVVCCLFIGILSDLTALCAALYSLILFIHRLRLFGAYSGREYSFRLLGLRLAQCSNIYRILSLLCWWLIVPSCVGIGSSIAWLVDVAVAGNAWCCVWGPYLPKTCRRSLAVFKWSKLTKTCSSAPVKRFSSRALLSPTKYFSLKGPFHLGFSFWLVFVRWVKSNFYTKSPSFKWCCLARANWCFRAVSLFSTMFGAIDWCSVSKSPRKARVKSGTLYSRAACKTCASTANLGCILNNKTNWLTPRERMHAILWANTNVGIFWVQSVRFCSKCARKPMTTPCSGFQQRCSFGDENLQSAGYEFSKFWIVLAWDWLEKIAPDLKSHWDETMPQMVFFIETLGCFQRARRSHQAHLLILNCIATHTINTYAWPLSCG